MVSAAHIAFRADDRSYFAILKKEIHALAVSAGFNDHRVGEIDIVVAELVSNLVKHAGGGQLLVKLLVENDLQGIELISVDNGKGISDVNRMISDGVSTKNTLGHGLGSMKRLADVFQIYSQKDWGTIILVRIFGKKIPHLQKLPRTDIRSVVLPKPGEEVSGDGFCSVTTASHVKLFLGDGLGHGVEAAAAVNKAIDAFRDCAETEPVEIIRHINTAVKKTRGLVGTAAILDLKEKKWRLCGVGNISTRINGPAFSKSYTAYNGIIGLNVPGTLNAQEIDGEKGQVLIMASDGLKSRWDIIKYPAILRYDLSILATSLLKDYARNTDDMSVAACKLNF